MATDRLYDIFTDEYIEVEPKRRNFKMLQLWQAAMSKAETTTDETKSDAAPDTTGLRRSARIATKKLVKQQEHINQVEKDLEEERILKQKKQFYEIERYHNIQEILLNEYRHSYRILRQLRNENVQTWTIALQESRVQSCLQKLTEHTRRFTEITSRPLY